MGRRSSKSSKAPLAEQEGLAEDEEEGGTKPEPAQGWALLLVKILVILINLFTLGLGIALVYYGITGSSLAKNAFRPIQLPSDSPEAFRGSPFSPQYNETSKGSRGVEEAWVLGDPYHSMIGLGACIIVISLLGLYSACSLDKHGLFGYYTAMMLMSALTVYFGVFCFLFAKDARSYQAFYSRVSADVNEPSAQMVSQSHSLAQVPQVLTIAGSLSLVTSALLCGGLYGASYLMGHSYAAKRLSMAMNLVTVVLGGFLLYLAILTTQTNYAGAWAAIIVAVAGGLTVLISLIGYFGLSRNKRWLLIIHAAVLCLVSLVMLVGAIICLAYRNTMQNYLESHWDVIQNKLTNVDKDTAYQTVTNHMVVIGVASLLLLACLLFNLGTSIHALRTSWRHWHKLKRSDEEAGVALKYEKAQVKVDGEGEESESEDAESEEEAPKKTKKGTSNDSRPLVSPKKPGKKVVEVELPNKASRQLEKPRSPIKSKVKVSLPSSEAKGGRKVAAKKNKIPHKGGQKGDKETSE